MKYLVTITDTRTSKQYKYLYDDIHQDLSKFKIVHEYGDNDSETLFKVTFEEVSE